MALVASTALLMVGCKKDEPPAPPPAASPQVTPPKGAEVGFPLGTGEVFYGGQMATPPLEWKTSDGTIVVLALVTTGKNDKGRESSVLRAWYAAADGAKRTQDLQPFELDPAVDHWAELKALANGRMLFRFGEADVGPSGRNAVILVWNAAGKEVRLAKRWRGDAKDLEPAWLTTGEYVASPEAGLACAKVVTRIVACGKDAKFREALFRNAVVTERAAMERHFDSHLVAWARPAAVAKQCADWASDAYVDTHLGEPTRLARLAEDTKMTCEFFGREIDDEGGLPRSAVEAKPTK